MYFCSTNRHVSVDMEKADAYVSGAVLGLLDRRGADLLRPAAEDSDTGALRDEESRLLARLNELAEDYADENITRSSARRPGTDRLAGRAHRGPVGHRSRGSGRGAGRSRRGYDVAARWEELDTDRRRAVVDALFEGVLIGRGRVGSRTFDPNRIMFVRHGKIT